jgi:hypothetical protein
VVGFMDGFFESNNTEVTGRGENTAAKVWNIISIHIIQARNQHEAEPIC